MNGQEMMAPRVTIGVPVYNGEKYLDECLNSLATQSYSDLEIVICDNASTDRTQQICEDYASRDSRIRYIRNPVNIGLGRNFRRVLELARGEYFKAAAADDVCAKEFIEQCVAALDRNPSAILAYPLTCIIDDHGNRVKESSDGINVTADSPRARFIHIIQNIRLCNALYGVVRTDILRRTAWLPEYRSADSVLLSELSLYGKFHELPEHLFFRRFHAGDTSQMSMSGKISEYLKPRSNQSIGMICVAWRRLLDSFRAVLRAPLLIGERLKLLAWLGRFAFWTRQELTTEIWLAIRVSWKRF
jgi:glycosyltransferase involved in cell wall biosynthesis